MNHQHATHQTDMIDQFVRVVIVLKLQTNDWFAGWITSKTISVD